MQKPAKPEGFNSLSFVDDDWDLLSPVLEPLENAGIRIDTYATFSEARKAITKIGQTDLLLLEIVLSPGQQTEDVTSPEKDYLGIKLLTLLRDSGILIPAIFFSDVYLPDVPGLGLTREDLDATYVNKISCRPKTLRDHIYERFSASQKR